MMTFDLKKSLLLKAASVALLMGTVTGCGSLGADQAYDPRVEHPIQVSREQVSVTINVPLEGAALSPEDTRRLRAFIRDFAVRGRSAVMVESQLGARARDVLLANGLRDGEVVLLPDTTVKAPGALLTFTANVAQVPDCGDWSDNTAFNPNNRPHPDFGCSTRRNTGLTVADPGDLIESQPMSGRGAARRDVVIDGYNAGEPITPPAAATSTTAVSGAGTSQ